MTYRIAVGMQSVLAWNKATGELSAYRKEALPDGVHHLARSGAIDVLRGRIVGVVPPACSTAWSVIRGRGGITLTPGSAHPTAGRGVRTGDRQIPIAILDLRDGGLVVAEGDRIARLAPVASGAGRGSAGGVGNAEFDLAYDFSP